MCLVGCRIMVKRRILKAKNGNGRNGRSSFLPFSFLFCTFANDEKQLSLPTPYKLLDDFGIKTKKVSKMFGSVDDFLYFAVY